MPLSAAKIEDECFLSKELYEDMPLSAAKIEDECFLSKELYGVKGRYAAFGGEDRGRMH